MSILSAAPRNGESGRGRGRPPCKTARAKKRPARKRSSNWPREAHASHSSSTFRKSGKKILKTWSNEIMNFGFSDLTGELRRVATFWWNPKAFSTFSILAHWTWDQHPDKSKLQHDRWNWYVESYPSTSQITWNHTYHHAAHAFDKHFVSCCSCPLPGRRCCYHHLDDANQIGIKHCKQKRSVLAKLFFHGRIFTLWFPESPPKILPDNAPSIPACTFSQGLAHCWEPVLSLATQTPLDLKKLKSHFSHCSLIQYETPKHGPALRLLCLDHLLLKSMFGYVWCDWAWYCLITCRRSKRAHVMTYDCTIFKWAKRTNKFEKVQKLCKHFFAATNSNLSKLKSIVEPSSTTCQANTSESHQSAYIFYTESWCQEFEGRSLNMAAGSSSSIPHFLSSHLHIFPCQPLEGFCNFPPARCCAKRKSQSIQVASPGRLGEPKSSRTPKTNGENATGHWHVTTVLWKVVFLL